MGLAKEFKQFLLRGNVVDLAVAVVIGAAFMAVVTAMVTYLITPLIAAIFGKPDFSQLYFTINNSHFMYGAFINAIIAFILIALVVFFFIVKPVNALISRSKKEEPADPNLRKVPRMPERNTRRRNPLPFLCHPGDAGGSGSAETQVSRGTIHSDDDRCLMSFIAAWAIA